MDGAGRQHDLPAMIVSRPMSISSTPTSARATATNRVTRLLGVLDEWLAGRDWVMGADYSIADISLLGWVEAVPERTPGFAIQALACTMLWIGALGGALWRLVH